MMGSLAGGFEFMAKMVLDGVARKLAARLLPFKSPGDMPALASLQTNSLNPFGGFCEAEVSVLGLRCPAGVGHYEETRGRCVGRMNRKNRLEEHKPRRSHGSGKDMNEKK